MIQYRHDTLNKQKFLKKALILCNDRAALGNREQTFGMQLQCMSPQEWQFHCDGVNCGTFIIYLTGDIT